MRLKAHNFSGRHFDNEHIKMPGDADGNHDELFASFETESKIFQKFIHIPGFIISLVKFQQLLFLKMSIKNHFRALVLIAGFKVSKASFSRRLFDKFFEDSKNRKKSQFEKRKPITLVQNLNQLLNLIQNLKNILIYVLLILIILIITLI